ncbi:MAG TPA: sensor histidine kinase [Vicinamibacterales bacterium]|jgi:sensor histidine kinase YesM|nr:sensor histidine kinase [Vicinamibacterales bacterium]
MTRAEISTPRWRRILFVNILGAVAVVGISGGFSPAVRLSALAQALGVSLVYANCIGTLLALVMPYVASRCWAERPATRWLILVSALALGTIVATVAATALLVAVGVVPRRFFSVWIGGALSTSLFISVVIGIGVTLYETMRARIEDATVALRTKERDEAEARRLATEAQLASLESRVQPHFLFNTLNSIAALAHDDPARAEKMTTDLASLLRSSLDQQSTPLVPLEEELRIVRTYLEIERVRFGERLRYRIDVDASAGDARVPRLAVQTLVENSVKYAVSPRRDGASIIVRAGGDNGRIRLSVQDDGPGFDATTLPHGHGLTLLRSRLGMLFADGATMRVESRPGETRVTVDVPRDPSSRSTDGSSNPSTVRRDAGGSESPSR